MVVVIPTDIIVFDQSVDASQTRLERWERIGRFLRNVQQHLDDIDEPLFLGCGSSAGYRRRQRQPGILQELGPVGVPPIDGGRFRRMPDMALASFMKRASEGMKAVRRPFQQVTT
jgi:hypothetical protein